MRIVIAILISLATFRSVASEETFIGLPWTLSCKNYLNEIEASPQLRTAYHWWISGYVAGLYVKQREYFSPDNRDYEEWFIGYCKRHPSATFASAAIKLQNELESSDVK